jgi:uncharacterized protein (DUF433 family)
MRGWYPGIELGTVNSIREHIEIMEGAGGRKARIVGHNFRVVDVVTSHITLGLSVEEIVEEWPTITLADVHAALAYYYDNREVIDAWMREDTAYVERMMREAGPSRLAEKIKLLREGQEST